MKYRALTPKEQEAYDVGYKVGNRQLVITDVEWESEQEHKIYRKGYMAGLMDYKRKVSNVNNVSKVSNVDIETPKTPITSTTPISISNSIGNKDIKTKQLINNLFSDNSNKFIISDSFVIPIDEEPFSMYAKELGPDIIKQVERWLIKSKNGVAVDKQFICKQFMNFAQRQGINILDIVKNGKNSQK